MVDVVGVHGSVARGSGRLVRQVRLPCGRMWASRRDCATGLDGDCAASSHPFRTFQSSCHARPAGALSHCRAEPHGSSDRTRSWKERQTTPYSSWISSPQLNDMSTPPARVFQLLQHYVAVHDEIFGGSWIRTLRKLIPIPGIFLAIDYRDCASRLEPLISELQSMSEPAAHDAYGSRSALMTHRYIEALLRAMKQLHVICIKLAGKAEGGGAYSSAAYARDVSRYNELVAAYSKIGEMLNEQEQPPRKPNVTIVPASDEAMARFSEWRTATPASPESKQPGPTPTGTGSPVPERTQYASPPETGSDAEVEDLSRDSVMTAFDRWTAALCARHHAVAGDRSAGLREAVRAAMEETLRAVLEGQIKGPELLAEYRSSGHDGAQVVHVSAALADELVTNLWEPLQRAAAESGISVVTALANTVIDLVEQDRPPPPGPLHPGHFAVIIDYAAALMIQLARVGPGRARALVDGGPSAKKAEAVSREQALEVVRDHLEATGRARSSVTKVHSIGEIDWRPPMIYGQDLEDCWIAYIERPQPEGGWMIGPSHVVLVSKDSGEVVYDGSAHDEG